MWPMARRGERTPHRSLYRLLDVSVLGLAMLLLVPLLHLWSLRIFHPLDLEWMEGGMLGHAWRIKHGLPLYDAPASEFVPYLYPPGYAAVVAALSMFFPLDYPLARTVSLASSFAAAGAIVWCGARQLRDPMMGILGGFLFLLCYGGSGAFYDLARVDGLAIGLLSWAIVLGAERNEKARVAAAVFLCAAFLVKHSYALFGLPMMLGMWARDGFRKALRFGVLAAAPAFFLTLWLNHVTHGGFIAYVVGVPLAHPMIRHQAFPGSFGELARLLGIAWAVAIAMILMRGMKLGVYRGVVIVGIPALCGAIGVALMPHLAWPVGVGLLDDSIRMGTLVLFGATVGASIVVSLSYLAARKVSWRWVYGGGIGLCALLISALMRGHQGGYTNVLIPGHWALVVAMTTASARLRHAWPGWPSFAACAVAWSAQLTWVAEPNDIARLSPRAEDVAIGRRIVEQVRRCKAPVLSPFAAWLPVQAGFAPSSHLISLWDIDHPGGARERMIDEFRAAVRDHHWGCIVDDERPLLDYGVRTEYPNTVPLNVPDDALVPTTGWRGRPRVIRLAPK
ncbi:MAG: hypothetical protein IPM54_05755 [Polyangiaceae bacterium]|nr:hypothetical protein [Polyangiaceae bacterium]